MYIYGGYQDLRGSTSELWAFHLPSSTWHLVSQVKIFCNILNISNLVIFQYSIFQGGAADCPPKHHHSAVVHNQAMWVFGGMSDLQERSDCWKFDFGELSSHGATCQFYHIRSEHG